MGLDLEDIANDVAHTVAYYSTSEIKVGYRPALLTQEKIGQVEASGQDTDFIDYLSQILVDWDITKGGPKKKVPITPDGIRSIPVPVLRAIFYAIMQEGSDASGEAARP